MGGPPIGAILECIADRVVALRSYLAVRDVCTAWRSAVAPPSPCLLYVRPVLAVSHPLERPFLLSTLESSTWCVGSGGGWLATMTLSPHVNEAICVALVNPHTGQAVTLPLMRFDPAWPCVRFKVVFARNPRQEDFTVVAICGDKTVACVSAGHEAWSFHENMELADVACHHSGGPSKFYCLTKSGAVLAVRVPRGGGHGTKEPVLERLIPGGVPSDDPGGQVFPLPYARASEHTSAKYLAFCEGSMYQVWRNTGGAVDLPRRPGREGPWRVSEDEVFVLRYAPVWRGPCWEAARCSPASTTRWPTRARCLG